jgi:lipopolysaccharide/colanic/teichoic acid biosynthesis glycosyltransferase
VNTGIGGILGLSIGTLNSFYFSNNFQADLLPWIFGYLGLGFGLVLGSINGLKISSHNFSHKDDALTYIYLFRWKFVAVLLVTVFLVSIPILNLFPHNSPLSLLIAGFVSFSLAVFIDFIYYPLIISGNTKGLLKDVKNRLWRTLVWLAGFVLIMFPFVLWLFLVRIISLTWSINYFMAYILCGTIVGLLSAIWVKATPVTENSVQPYKKQYSKEYIDWKNSVREHIKVNDVGRITKFLDKNVEESKVALFTNWLIKDDPDTARKLLLLIEDTPFIRSLATPLRAYSIAIDEYSIASWDLVRKDLELAKKVESPSRARSIQLLLKRIFDLIFCVSTLICFFPMYLLLLFGFLSIEYRSPLMSIYKSRRVGRYGRLFHHYEFRFTKETGDEDRPSRIRSFLIWSSLYRVPELYNVLKGEMTMVGPYPMFPTYLIFRATQNREFIPKITDRLQFPPGITDPTVLLAFSTPKNYFRCPVDCLGFHADWVNRWKLTDDLKEFVRGFAIYFGFLLPNLWASLLKNTPPPPATNPYVPLPTFLNVADY